MAEEEKKVEEVTEGAEVEATEDKKDKKAKKEKKGSSVDVNAIMNKAKEGVGQGSEKITSMVKEADDKKKMVIFLAIIALEVVLSLIGGVNAIILIVEIIVALVGFVALKAAFPGEEKEAEEKTEE